MAKFTHGPWRLFHKHRITSVLLADDSRQEVVHWSGFDASSFPKAARANAALIAAAPEMYAFIAKQISEMNCICRMNKLMAKMDVHLDCTVCAGKKLLAKAGGGR